MSSLHKDEEEELPESTEDHGRDERDAEETSESVSDLKGSLEQQQAMIGQLREALKSKSSSKVQETGAEDYATRLAKMKPRLVRGRGRAQREKEMHLKNTKTKEAESTEPSKSEMSELTGKNDEIKESKEVPVKPEAVHAAEENVESSFDCSVTKSDNIPVAPRVHPSSSLSSVQGETSSRAKLLLLRKQREENRIKFERQFRQNAEKKATMDEMKDRIERLRLEVEERDHLIESFKVNTTTSDPNIQHLYQQIMYKDNTIMDLTEKLTNLESVIQDQKEQLSEKEQIIAARTEAVSLVAKDRDDKLYQTLQELEETQQNLRNIQEESLSRHHDWKEKDKSLQAIIDGKNKRISTLEENTSRIENVRFELSTHNAELQEKIVLLQSEGEKVKDQLKQCKEEVSQQTETISDLQKKIVRAESFGQKKLKAFEKQLRSLEKESTLEQSLVELQNIIAELEEEKGNLQLKLVDFDDIKATNSKISETISSLEDKLDSSNQECNNSLSTISALEKEKIKLIDVLNAKDLNIVNLDEQIVKYQEDVEKLSQAKVTLELRLCAVEEERDVALSREVANKDSSPIAIKEDDNSTFSEISLLKTQLEEINLSQRNTLKAFEEVKLSLETQSQELDQKSEENAFLINLLAEKEATITTQSISLEQHDSVVDEFKDEIKIKNQRLEKQNGTLATLQQECADVSMKLDESHSIMNSWEDKVNRLQDELHNQRETIHRLKVHEEKTAKVIQEKNNLVQNLEGEICSLKETLEQKESSFSLQLDKLEKLDNLLVAREEEISDLKNNLGASNSKELDMETLNKKLQNDLVNIETSLKATISNLEMELEAASCIISDKENRIETLLEEIKFKEQGIKNNQIMISKFESELCEKNKLYDILLDERAKEEVEKVHLNSQISSLESELKTTQKDLEGLQIIIKEKELSLEHIKDELGCCSEKSSSLEEKVRSLEFHSNSLAQENQELQRTLGEKDESVNALQEEISQTLSNQKDESSNLASALVEKEMEIQKLQTSIFSTSHDASAQSDLVEKWQSELLEKCQQLTDAEEKLLSKDQEISALTQNMQSINETLLSHQAEYTHIKENYESNLQQMQQNLASLQNEKCDLISSLEISEKAKQNLEEYVSQINSQLEEKSREALSLQKQIDEQTELLSHKQYDFKDLQDKLNNSQQHLNQLQAKNQELETQRQELEHHIGVLNNALNDAHNKLESKNTEIESLKVDLFQNESNIKNFEEKSGMPSESSCCLSKETEINLLKQKLQDSESELESLKTNFSRISDEFESLKNAAPIELSKFEPESLPVIASNSDDSLSMQITQLQNDLTASQDERKHLKLQLEEAQQAIIHLETSLATQSIPKEAKDDQWDEWGDVDLGQPTVDESSLSMQSSLIEKDKALTVIQEQLKDALEQVNTVTDEKKLIEHQMKTLEAELSHKDQKINSYQEKVSSLESENSNLLLSIQQFDSQRLAFEEAQSKLLNYDSVLADYQAKIAQLQTQLDALKANVSTSASQTEETNQLPSESSVSASTDAESPSATTQESADLNDREQPASNSDSQIKELQYKLTWYEEQWTSWMEHYNQLQLNFQTAEEKIVHLNEHIESLNASREESLAASLEETTTRITELENEINRLRHFETENSQLQGQIQTLEHQCAASEKSIAELQSVCSKLQGIEVLYVELQSSMQVAETKREGSKSRVQELELMVQSAESEISRLRIDLQTLNSAGKSLETERSVLSEEISNLKEEIRKINTERERVSQENSTLQTQAGSLHSQLIEHQQLSSRMNAEVNQLRSELEVMEGENERFRINYEILEGEATTLRNDIEALNQNNHLINAQKESLETEVQRLNARIVSLSSETEHHRGEVQRFVELSTSAESEITRLKSELDNTRIVESHCHELKIRNAELEQKVPQLEQMISQLEEEANNKNIVPQQHPSLLMEEVDWSKEGKIENEHLQRSSSVTIALEDEVASLKEKVISLEKERNLLGDELQASKIKNGKMIQKMKAATNKYDNMKKEYDKLKQKSGEFPDLDQALEDEWKSQVAKAESERDETKVKLDELETEKKVLVKKMDVLENVQEKYFELKEAQDASLIKLSDRNRELEGLVSSLEWKISEYEERGLDNVPHTMPTVSDDGEVLRLNHKINELQGTVSSITSENKRLKLLNQDLESRVESLIQDNENFQSLLERMKDARGKAEADTNTYKSTYLELHKDHETLKEKMGKLEDNFSQLSQEHLSFKSAYDSLYQDYNEVASSRESLKYELGILSGEKTKLHEEIGILKNRLDVLMEEEEEEIIRSLQDECESQRVVNSELKDEITQLQEDLRLSQEEQEKTKISLEQQLEVQEILRTDHNAKTNEVLFLNNSIENQERQLKYLTAENNSAKVKSAQQQSALVESDAELKKIEGKLRQLSEENSHLIQQIRVMESSLKGQLPSPSPNEGDSSSAGQEVSTQELSSALSSLHLRDLRCQQLTLEINKLLEERDSLQLKLSASLRQNQELGRELTLSQQMPAPTSPPSLNQKLKELRELNMSMERKAIDKLTLSTTSMPPTVPTFTSHTAPPTPTATRQADYTVVRENQGTSSTLFGWILGKSPPKAVLHI